MKKYFYLATALVALAACSNEEYVGDNSPTLGESDGSIQFGFETPAMTRADIEGSAAATKLGNTFYVYGIKCESADGAGNVGATHTVFKNYVVKYTDNTAYTTTSNTKNWEYVGKSLSTNEAANINANNGTGDQTVKYWDYSAPDYTFYAFSAKSADIEDGKVRVEKNQTNTTDVYENGYTVTLASGASLDDVYFSERLNIVKSTGTDRTAKNAYGGNVTLRFRNAATKVRVAMYETLPGHSVKINSFKVANAANPAFDDMTTVESTNFKANFVNNVSGTAGSAVIKYGKTGTVQNWPIVTLTPTDAAANILTLGTNIISVASIGTVSTTPTYDKLDGESKPVYTSVFPKEDNTQNLKLKVTYTLTSTDGSGETTTVTDATAEIPAEFLKWKPGYAYTYIFKISENTNGSTGGSSDPKGLYPITFDAVATVTEDGLAEYITTVSEPSITTFGVKSSKYVSGNNEYQTGTDIYATIMDGSSVADFTIGSDAAGGVNVYKVSTSDASFPVTEASVAESLREISVGATKITCTKKNDDGITSFTAIPAKVTSVPTEVGGTISITAALKLTNVQETGLYAVEYVKTPATYHCTEHTYASAAEVTTALASVQLYKDAAGNTPATASDWESASTKFYTRDAVNNVGVYTYKIIKVE